jgi:tRNA dimethylallyltransferase
VAPGSSGDREAPTKDMSERDKPVIAIFGPTASGKTAVAEAVADALGGEVVSADSMQVYRGLPILTAQPERPTRLVGIWPLSHEASVGEYAELAHAAIDDLLTARRTPVVAGGTGLYLRAALADLELPPAPPPGERRRWERLYDDEGAEQAHTVLAARDPRAAAVVHPNDRRRVVRALELAAAGASLRPPESRLWSGHTRRPTLVFGLDVPKDELDRRITERAQNMFAAGAVEEAGRAVAGELSSTARHILGLRELTELPRAEALDALIARTRRYAAYQRKWMRRIPGIVTLDGMRSPDAIAAEIVKRAA